MKRLAVSVLILCLAGCTTLRPVGGTPCELQQRIVSGAVLKRGDHVVILTSDGRAHEFNVVSVSASSIDGRHESIPMDQIASVQKREMNGELTAMTVGLTVVRVALSVVLVVGMRGFGDAAILGSSH